MIARACPSAKGACPPVDPTNLSLNLSCGVATFVRCIAGTFFCCKRFASLAQHYPTAGAQAHGHYGQDQHDYLVSAWPWFRVRAGLHVFWPLAVLGRQALPVFALGTILSFVARALRELWTLGGNTPSFMFDSAVIIGGILLQLAIAILRDRAKALERNVRDAVARTTPPTVAVMSKKGQAAR